MVEFIETPPVEFTERRAKRPFWAKKRMMVALVAGLLLVSAMVSAAILIQQNVTANNSSQVSDVQFVDGGGGLTGFATLAVDSSGASATLTLTGVAGASLQATGLLQIQNTDATQAYNITLVRSAAPNAAISSMTFTVLDGATPVETYDAAAAASGTQFNLPVSTTYDIQIDVDIADGTAAGSLGSFTLEFLIVPV